MHPGSSTYRESAQSMRKLQNAIEALEFRRLLAVTPMELDSNGWSKFTRPPEQNIVYVSWSSGSDSNPGTLNSPVKSIKRGKQLMAQHDGKHAWLLLKRGDTWTRGATISGGDTETGFQFWSYGGKDYDEPMLIGSYGYYFHPQLQQNIYFDPANYPSPTQFNLPPRPKVNSGTGDGIAFAGTNKNHVAIVGLSFAPIGMTSSDTYNGKNSIGTTGIRAQVNAKDYLIEDVRIGHPDSNGVNRGYKDGVAVGNPGAVMTDFIIRRSQILDSYNGAGAHAQGMYVSGVCKDVLIEQNTFDHNGWNDSVSGAHKTVFNHNMYINTNAQGVIVQGNIVTRGSLRGTLLRAGGEVYDNLYIQNAVAIQVGNTSSKVKGNVILEGVDLPDLASGVGIDVAFSMNGVEIENNIIAHDRSAYTYNLSGINLNGGTRNATVKNNIVYDWRRTFINGVTGGTNIVENNVFEDLDGYHPVVKETNSGTTNYKNNKYYVPNTKKYSPPKSERDRAFQDGNPRMSFDQWTASHNDTGSTMGTLVQFVDPNRDMAGYNATVGGQKSFDAWINTQRNMSRETGWHYAKPNLTRPYTAAHAISYIRGGFNAGSAPASAQVINVEAIDETASELGDVGVFRVTRDDPTGIYNSLIVNYELTGSATANVDYLHTISPVTGLRFEQGQSEILVTITPTLDLVSEGDENVRFNIQAHSDPINPLYIAGTSPSATITISDALATVNVQANVFEASEDGPVNGEFTLTRSGPTLTELTVHFEISGSATHALMVDAENAQDYLLESPGSNLTTELVTQPGNPPLNYVFGTATFPIGESSITITVIPLVDSNDTEGDETVGLTLRDDINIIPLYVPGVSEGDTVSIYDHAQEPPPGGGGNGGGGGVNNPPPLGKGLHEVFYNGQENFIPDAVFDAGTSLETIYNDIKNGVYGPVGWEKEADGRPGFSFNGVPHPGIDAEFFSTIWTGQFQPQFEERYTLYLTMDADAYGVVWVQDDTGIWNKVVDPNDLAINQNFPNRHLNGDANDDGKVNALDFNVLATNFGSSGKKWADGDFNGDGIVNTLDFTRLANNYQIPDTRKTQDSTRELNDPQGPGAGKDFAPRGTIDLQAGVRYNVVIMYTERRDVANIRLLWKSESRPLQEIPKGRLYASAAATSPPLPAMAPALSGAPAASLFSTSEVDDLDTVLS